MEIITVLLIGASGITAQVLLLRELLVSFYGNELTLGVILSNWILTEALGVYLTGRAVDRIKDRYSLFIFFEIIFALTFPLSVYLSRTFKSIIGISPGQGLGLDVIFWSSLFIILPIGFSHGGLFSLACRLFADEKNRSASTIGKVYYWETAGTLLGSVILTFLFIPRLNSFSIVSAISILNILTCFLYLRFISVRKRVPVIFSLLCLSLCAFAIIPSSYLQKSSVKRQYSGSEVLAYRNSVYGNIAVTQSGSQRTFFYNGIPAITTPFPDIASAEDFGNFPLLFHPEPKNVLLISHAAGGLLNEVEKHPVEKIDYVESDPLLFTLLRSFPSDLTNRELSDKRVNLIFSDGRFFLNSASVKYDVIMLGASGPTDLSSNRFFTKEFFALAKSRLKLGGILAFRLPGSLTYISDSVRDLNSSVTNSIKSEFSNYRVIPGDYNLVLATDSGFLLEATSRLLSERITGRNIKTTGLLPQYLDFRMDEKRLDWFRRSTLNATDKKNSDFLPFALMPMLSLWNQQFNPAAALLFNALRALSLRHIFIFIFVLTVAVSFLKISRPESGARLSVGYALITTGFYAMLVNIILIFSFQMSYGYLYEKIGSLIAVFMAGTASGGFISTRRIRDKKHRPESLIRIEVLIGVFCLMLAPVLYKTNFSVKNIVVFIFLFFISGFLAGLEFPIAGMAVFGEKDEIGRLSGMLYSFDLIGGCIAGIIGSIVLLPLLGLFNSTVAIAFLKASSIITLMLKKSKKKVDKN